MEKATSNQWPPGKISTWLFPALADLDERMKSLVTSACEEDINNAGDTFAERAEWYYQKRPQLIALLKDLYNGYLTLLNRYESTKRRGQQEEEDGEITSQSDSDLDSSLSYQQQPPVVDRNFASNIDEVVAALVVKNVENDMLRELLGNCNSEQLCNESWRKIELLKKLLELLESERMILLNENTELGYRVNSLLEENKALASEAIFMKRKAAELARCALMRMREDHRVCILSRKIEDLQGQIYGLEKRNKEYYQLLMKPDHEMKQKNSCNSNSGGCFQLEKLKLKKVNNGGNVKGICERKMSKWWEKVVNVDMFMCGLHSTST